VNFPFEIIETEHDREEDIRIGREKSVRHSAAKRDPRAVITFKIVRTSLRGEVTEYEGLFSSSAAALEDCVKTFGLGGRVRVTAL